MTVAVQLLGQQIVSVDGEIVGPLAPQQRRLLSLLASQPGQQLGREWLAEGLWGSADGAQLRALQVHISHLRGVLGKDVIEHVTHGYRLIAAADDVDEARFRQLVAEGKDALTHGHYDDAITCLSDALALWRGEPYQDLTTDEFLARRAGLRELRASAEDGLLRARVELIRDVGDAEAVIPLSTHRYAEQPNRESRAILHMRCLMAAGRLTDAANVATDYRRRVHREVGVEPGVEFAEMAARIMRRDPAVMPAAWRSRIDVPTYLLPLLHRDHEHEIAVSLLKWNSVRLLCVTGEHGVGKTRLAAAVAETLGHGFPGGVIWLDGERTRESDDVLAGVAEAVGVRATSNDLRQRLSRAVGRRRTLVVLDGVQGDDVMAAVAVLLAAGPLVSILVTGAQRLGLASEHELRLHPLSVGDGEATQFVVDVVEALGGDPRSPDSSLVSLSAGMPLALEQIAISMLSEVSRA